MDFVSPFDSPNWYMAQAEYDAALSAWQAAIPPGTRHVNVPEFFFRHPPTPSAPETEPEPTNPPALAAWDYGVEITPKRATLYLFEGDAAPVKFFVNKSSRPDAYAALVRFRDAVIEAPGRIQLEQMCEFFMGRE
jgi:hypothetical protein